MKKDGNIKNNKQTMRLTPYDSHALRISGIGIHSGAPVNMKITPRTRGGIVFVRTDLAGAPVPACYDNVGAHSMQNTTVGTGNNCVKTIEHLCAALYIMGIDNALIEIDGPEVPILDGSAYEFCKLLKNIQNKKQNARHIIVKKEIIATRSEIIRKMPFLARVSFLFNNFIKGRKSDGFVRLYPFDGGLKIDATISYPDKIIGTQSAHFVDNGTATARNDYIKNFARARTFGSLHEWDWLKKRGMARGANEKNVIALNRDGDATINKLHSPDEFVRHKITDILGDMMTSGGRIIGGIESYKGSHDMDNLVLRKLFSNPDNYEEV